MAETLDQPFAAQESKSDALLNSMTGDRHDYQSTLEAATAVNPAQDAIDMAPFGMFELSGAENTPEGFDIPATAAEIRDVEQRYNVDILEDGGTSSLFAKARNPNVRELESIDEALKRSQPAQLTADGSLMQIAIPVTRTSDKAAYYHGKDSSVTSPIIVIEPDQLESIGQDTFTDLVTHEIAHAGQDGFIRNDEERLAYMADTLGFVESADGRWLLRTKDLPEQFFTNIKTADEQGPDEYYARTDESGTYLDAQGKPVDDFRKAERLTVEDMMQRSKLRPVSDYFVSPAEFGAEAMVVYRSDLQRKAAFLAENPELYTVAKTLDLDELGEKFGYTSDDAYGLTLKMRNQNGEIVDNSEANRASLTAWEQQAAKRNR